MPFFLFLLLTGAFLAVAGRCPDTVIGRFVAERLLSPLVRRFSTLTWRGALLGLAAMVAMLLLPEMAVLVAGVDMAAIIELTLLAGMHFTRLRWTQVTAATRDFATRMISQMRSRPAPRARRIWSSRPHKSPSKDSDGAAAAWGIAALA